MQGEPKQRKKISHPIRLMLAIIASCIWIAIMLGNSNELTNDSFRETDQSIEYVFETTLAIETKRFRKKIDENETGILSYLPFVNQRSIQLEIQLITRIGFKVEQLNGLVTDNNQIRIEVLEPAILDRKWETNIIGIQDSLLHRWQIEQYEREKQQMITQIIDRESKLMLESFKQDNNKMGALVRRVQYQLAKQSDGNKFSLRRLADRINQKANQFTLQLFSWNFESQKPPNPDNKKHRHDQKMKTSGRQHDHKQKNQQREKRKQNEQKESARKMTNNIYDEDTKRRNQMIKKLKQ